MYASLLLQGWSLLMGLTLISSTGTGTGTATGTDTAAASGETHVVVLGKESGRSDFPADAIYEEGTLLEGERNGLWKRFHNNGLIRSEIHYAGSVPFGDYRLYDDQGRLYEEGRWEFGMNVGQLLRYWPNGELQQQLTFDSQGVAQGQQRHYHDNGQLEMVVDLQNGEESGDLIRLDREGRVIQRTTYRNGQLVQRAS